MIACLSCSTPHGGLQIWTSLTKPRVIVCRQVNSKAIHLYIYYQRVSHAWGSVSCSRPSETLWMLFSFYCGQGGTARMSRAPCLIGSASNPNWRCKQQCYRPLLLAIQIYCISVHCSTIACQEQEDELEKKEHLFVPASLMLLSPACALSFKVTIRRFSLPSRIMRVKLGVVLYAGSWRAKTVIITAVTVSGYW